MNWPLLASRLQICCSTTLAMAGLVRAMRSLFRSARLTATILLLLALQ